MFETEIQKYLIHYQEPCAYQKYHQRTQQKQEIKSNAAAIKIQRAWKNHIARTTAAKSNIQKENNELSDDLVQKSLKYINDPSKIKQLPKAASGRTPVYFPENLPIVLKQSASKSQNRVLEMEEARTVCNKIGCKHLVVPNARIVGDFIVESRLPIQLHNSQQQILLYMDNRDKFTPAVKEFTALSCQSVMLDLVGGTNDPYESLSETPMGRYDNAVLYIEGDIAKIGLVDLDGFSTDISRWCEIDYFYSCRDAVRLFPLHFDEILEVVKTFSPDIERKRKYLEPEREGALQRFKVIQETYNFIKENIALNNPAKMVEISSEKVVQIQEKIKSILLEEHQKPYSDYKNCLGDNSEETLQHFEQTFPKILAHIKTFLEATAERNLKSNKNIITYSNLLLCRKFHFSYSNIFYLNYRDNIEKELSMIKLPWEAMGNFLDFLNVNIFEQLVKAKVIAYFNPCFGVDCYAKPYIIF